MLNKVILIGRLTKDAEVHTTAAGSLVSTISIAVTSDFKNKEGQYDSDFFECVAFRNTADYLAKYVSKGDLVSVSGRLSQDSWVDNDGKKRYKINIIIESVNRLIKSQNSAETTSATVSGRDTQLQNAIDNPSTVDGEEDGEEVLPF